MTEIEALEILNNECEDVGKVQLALHIARKSLEKQIAKKVIFVDGGEELLCPCCGIDFMGTIQDADHDPYYCFECGQALDWGNEDDRTD